MSVGPKNKIMEPGGSLILSDLYDMYQRDSFVLQHQMRSESSGNFNHRGASFERGSQEQLMGTGGGGGGMGRGGGSDNR